MSEKFTKQEALQSELRHLVEIGLMEDKAIYDITSDLVLVNNQLISFKINARQNIVLCGLEVVKYCFDYLRSFPKFSQSKITCNNFYQDGDLVTKGSAIVSGIGDAKLVFAAERIMLNLLQHLSGIATTTNQLVKLLDHSKTKILDTRKTLPGLRIAQKYAVKIGGGYNHRFSLADMILIKDNHIDAAGSIADALKSVKERNAQKLMVEIECDNLDQLSEILASGGADIIMFDNMTIEEIKLGKIMVNNQAKIEVSGGVNLGNIKEIVSIGVDYVSIGALTHSVAAVDIGLDLELPK